MTDKGLLSPGVQVVDHEFVALEGGEDEQTYKLNFYLTSNDKKIIQAHSLELDDEVGLSFFKEIFYFLFNY